MNWFTRSDISASSPEYKQARLEEDGGCEHVDADINLAVALRREMDSFGPVSSHVCCKACDEKAQEEEGNEPHECRDCHLTFPKKEGVLWKWYDFYAPQGDEPLFICNGCKTQPTHQNRLKKDQEDYEREQQYYDND